MNTRKWLVDTREAQELTQLQIADIVSISRAHYANIENGLRRPSYEVAKKIADILDFDWTLFFEDNENAS